jgi:DNA-binding LacI/PurR family transcriptional regulator
MPASRKTIAVLIDHIDQLSHGYESQLRWGFMRACASLDINLLIVAGRALRAPEPWGASRNGVYDLMHPDCVDGLILMSNGIIGSCSIEELQDICRRYAPLPICSAGLAIPDVPSIVIDNRPGMEALCEHLIRDHGRRRVALLAGPDENPDAKLRSEVYREVLARHGIDFDPELVAVGALTSNEGRKAMEELLSRGVEFDAVVAANDAMAMGASELLRRRGRSGGPELSLVGFDDLALARLREPAAHDSASAARRDGVARGSAAGRPDLRSQSAGAHLAAGPAHDAGVVRLHAQPAAPDRQAPLGIRGGLAHGGARAARRGARCAHALARAGERVRERRPD